MPETTIQTPTTGTPPPTGTGPGAAGDPYQTFVAQLPEQYRSDPLKFITDYTDLNVKYSRAAQVEQWYRDKYLPWQQETRGEFEEFQQWRKNRGNGIGTPAPAGTAPGTPATPEPADDEVDWSDPEAPQKAYARTRQWKRDTENQVALTKRELQERSQAFIDLMKLQMQAREIESQDLYGHLKYTPRRDVNRIAQYALEKGLNDLHRAADELYRDALFQDREKVGYERGKQEAQQELAGRRSTTESTSGVPARVTGRQGEIPKGYGSAGREELLQRIAAKRPNIVNW